jgi:mono/diheme cytochrome c family protein
MSALRIPLVLLIVSTVVATSDLSAAEGATLFKQHCALCHGKDGKANTPIAKKLGVKDLTVSKTADAEIERQIREGKLDDKGKVLMPAFAQKLSKEDITALLGTVKSFRP